MRMRAGVISTPRRFEALAHGSERALVDVDADAERLGDAVGGDVVVGRTDAARREDVVVARSRSASTALDDLHLLVGDDAHFLHLDADGGQMVGDVADVLVLACGRRGSRRRSPATPR